MMPMFSQHTNGTHSTLSGRRWGNSEVLKLQEFWFSPACAACWHWPSDRALCHLIRHGLAQAPTLSGLLWSWAGLVFPPQPHFTESSRNQQKGQAMDVSKVFFTSTVNRTKKLKTIPESLYASIFFPEKTDKQENPKSNKQKQNKKLSVLTYPHKKFGIFQKIHKSYPKCFCVPPAFLKRMDVASNF